MQEILLSQKVNEIEIKVSKIEVVVNDMKQDVKEIKMQIEDIQKTFHQRDLNDIRQIEFMKGKLNALCKTNKINPDWKMIIGIIIGASLTVSILINIVFWVLKGVIK